MEKVVVHPSTPIRKASSEEKGVPPTDNLGRNEHRIALELWPFNDMAVPVALEVEGRDEGEKVILSYPKLYHRVTSAEIALFSL